MRLHVADIDQGRQTQHVLKFLMKKPSGKANDGEANTWHDKVTPKLAAITAGVVDAEMEEDAVEVVGEVLKKPAASGSRLAPSVNEGEDAKPVESGVDERRPSRAQMYIFTKSEHLIPPDIWTDFKTWQSTDCKVPGKRKKIHALVNTFVPRDAGWKSVAAPHSLAAARSLWR